MPVQPCILDFICRFSVILKTGLIQHKGIVGGSKSHGTIGLHQSVLKAGLLMETVERRDVLFTSTCGERIQHPRQIICMMCFYLQLHETQHLGQRGCQTALLNIFSVNTRVFRSPSDLLKKEENRFLFAELVNLRAFRLMVSETFLLTCWD